MNTAVIDRINEQFTLFLKDRITYLSNVGNGIGTVPESQRKIITSNIPGLLSQLIDPQKFKIKGSIGSGRISKTPWIAVMNKTITITTQSGVYLVFLIDENLDKVYLNLGIGAAEFGTTKTGMANLETERDALRQQLRNGNPYLEENVINNILKFPTPDIVECI